jgi:hypothetical protein
MDYTQSFNFNKTHLVSIIIDILLAVLLFSTFTLYSGYVQNNMATFNNVGSPETIQYVLEGMDPQKALEFTTQLRDFVGFFITGIIGMILLLFFGFSFSRCLLWNYLVGRKFSWKKYWRWNALALFVFLLVLLYSVLVIILRLSLLYIFTKFTTDVTALAIFHNVFNSAILTIFIVFLFILFYHFTKKYRIFTSVGSSFALFKNKKVITVTLFAWLTSFIPLLISIPFNEPLRFSPHLTLLTVAITVIYLTWLRLYVYHTIKHI